MGTQVGTCFNTTTYMFTQLDYELFPDTPEVYKLPSGKLVAKILKNASSSIDKEGYKLATLKEIQQAQTITVYWREPIARFKSGVSTFVHQTGISMHTAVKYLFLNKHYAPQFYTLINLHRYMNEQTSFVFKSIDKIREVTVFHERPYNTMDVPVSDKVQFYMTCDKMIWDNYIDEQVHFDELMRVLRINYKEYYKEVFEHSKNIHESI